MLTKFNKFVKENVHWFVFGLCVVVLAMNLGRLANAPKHKGHGECHCKQKAAEAK